MLESRQDATLQGVGGARRWQESDDKLRIGVHLKGIQHLHDIRRVARNEVGLLVCEVHHFDVFAGNDIDHLVHGLGAH